MWPFSNKDQPIEPLSKHIESNDRDLSDLNSLNAIVDKEIKKTFDYSQFQMGSESEEGNYFGSEFDIRATVARLKALYVREPWVYATASLIARTLGTVPFLVTNKKTGDVLENHELNKIINGGNYLQDQQSRDMSGYLDLVLTGNYFMITDEAYKMGIHIPVESANLKPRPFDSVSQREEVIKNGPIEAIEINGQGTSASIVPFEQVIHFKLANPFNPLYGLSMFTAAARPILLDRYKNEFEMAFYLRGATNSGVIETDQDISKTRMERLMRTFEQAFTGKRNWWRTLFLPKGARWVSSGLTMNEMQHLEGLRENRLTLLAVLGVPPSQIGIVQDVNRATSETQEAAFWQNCIMPLVWYVAGGWNNSYLIKQVYKGEIEIVPDLTGVEALEGSLYTKAELANSLADWLKVNEIREDILGYEALPPDDVRGEMFAKEVRAQILNPYGDIAPAGSATEEEEAADSTEEEQTRAATTIANTGDGDGEFRHSHSVQWSQETGDGVVLDTQGDGPYHDHQIKAFKVLEGGDDKHKHPNLVTDTELETMDMKAAIKKTATDTQDRLEKTQGDKYHRVLNSHVDH